MSPPLLLRAADPADAGEILTVQRAAFVTEAQAHDTPHLPPLVETLTEVRAALTDGGTRVLVAELAGPRGGRLVGAARCTVRDGRGWIGRVAVAPDVAGTGIGSALLQRLHDDLGPSVTGFSLWTGGRSTGNHAWYAGHGYLVTGRTADHLGVPVVTMARPVLRGAPDPLASVVVVLSAAPDGPRPDPGEVAAGPLPGELARGALRHGESLRTAALRLAGPGAAFVRPLAYYRTGGDDTPVLATVLVRP
ncbi:hypothetical protein GCM10011594_39320 [Nakamurella endophytica]|uniref:N-acetyltransferase domain-containing protein n=1 Tax=Nakamurella endophytica TaxID=1748367 RepID=A0A917T9K1_9ACTN|nr:hypothetical protein GCM10011594_39320 [Nakamurella endophytica]